MENGATKTSMVKNLRRKPEQFFITPTAVDAEKRCLDSNNVHTAGVFTEKSGHIEEDLKSTADAVAAKLTASTSSVEMLTYVLSSQASEGVISNQIKELAGDYSSKKKAKIENDHAFYVPQNPQASVPPYSHHASIQHNLPFATLPLPPLPPMQPYPIPQYMPTSWPVPNVPYRYNNSKNPSIF
ncbi:hypothetical protein Fot_31281 [Forsythia ovata]|uniref:Uncharacterized protein n=1 Tax=Forsythia ovata TaxID=205694 RepID=A0ABD1T4I2_9LAMI